MTKTEKILSYHGIRPTQMRSKIYKFLKRKQSAVSFSDLKKAFVQKSETNKTANRTTFYRNLKIFEDKGLIHQINDGTGVAKYAISEDAGKKDLHLHFHCTQCLETTCLPSRMPEDCLPAQYQTQGVNLVLRGICKKCLRKLSKMRNESLWTEKNVQRT
ncbi:MULTISPECIES: transcriptional repressor [Arenibacter]|uniref:Zinc uptake transcriptional repressor n=1 Tax=Arenibacter algicola TaxID=616991 RepID=A0A221UXQ6_9FLAO|nr:MULTISPECIES: transcriptional repressor [Arenibacter]ASO06023.1 zinc uptake transcriptional repressor [Arenibacter algicola]MCK0137168.1 transcriptional repressor [Arenibacter sp. S6351L]MCK0189100.1 transcriptional repressor [Arenibacter sp. F20364]MDX1768126.1 transcriptional repressor [Arenibacter troitsensis]|tara:strand:+ start:5439 stop:5915 length:477 start_codon:yes stop_codon:yes gene_type:complete